MLQHPYLRGPDSFSLTVPTDIQGLSLQFFESDWGITDEQLCFYEGTLLGIAYPVNGSTDIAIQLLPQLEKKRRYPWPSTTAFSQALVTCTEKSPRWLLHCAQDTDQHAIQAITDDAQVKHSMALALAYCEGKAHSCPGFVAGDKNLMAIYRNSKARL